MLTAEAIDEWGSCSIVGDDVGLKLLSHVFESFAQTDISFARLSLTSANHAADIEAWVRLKTITCKLEEDSLIRVSLSSETLDVEFVASTAGYDLLAHNVGGIIGEARGHHAHLEWWDGNDFYDRLSVPTTIGQPGRLGE